MNLITHHYRKQPLSVFTVGSLHQKTKGQGPDGPALFDPDTEGLLPVLFSDSGKPDQAKAEKKHGGGFRNRVDYRVVFIPVFPAEDIVVSPVGAGAGRKSDIGIVDADINGVGRARSVVDVTVDVNTDMVRARIVVVAVVPGVKLDTDTGRNARITDFYEVFNFKKLNMPGVRNVCPV